MSLYWRSELKMSSVSVIIPVYNGKNFITNAIRSVQAQTHMVRLQDLFLDFLEDRFIKNMGLLKTLLEVIYTKRKKIWAAWLSGNTEGIYILLKRLKRKKRNITGTG
jgi:hypothetical protein